MHVHLLKCVALLVRLLLVDANLLKMTDEFQMLANMDFQGVWAWGLAYMTLRKSQINTTVLLYPKSVMRHVSSDDEIDQAAYSIASLWTFILIASILAFWALTPSDDPSPPPTRYPLLPISCLLVMLAVLFWPTNSMFKLDRAIFTQSLTNILSGRLTPNRKFFDIVISDMASSYAKVLGDLWIVGYNYAYGTKSFSGEGSYGKDGPLSNALFALVVCFTFAIRFKQCICEYRETGQKQNLFNALKYFTSFPMLALSVLIASDSSIQKSAKRSGTYNKIYSLWIVASLINSLYSFYWDVTNDWDLQLLVFRKENKQMLLRPVIMFYPLIYCAVIPLNFVLRMTWSFRMIGPLRWLYMNETGTFIIEALEVLSYFS